MAREITVDELYACTREGYMLVAESVEDGSRIHIDDTVSGLACNCVCPGCGRDMIARKGKKNTHSFAHRPDQDHSDCRSAGETALHKFAKEVLGKRLRLRLPPVRVSDELGPLEVTKGINMDFEEVLLETRRGEVVPDVVCRKGGRDLHVEFRVTHACDEAKIAKLRAMDIGVIEIDLSRHRGEPLKHLEDTILSKAPRKWLHTRMLAKGCELLEERFEAEERRKDAEARELADIYTALPASGDRAVGPWERKAVAYGLEKAIAGNEAGPSCFKVRDAEWKAFILLEFACHRTMGFRPEHAYLAICSKGWVNRAFSTVHADIAVRVRKFEPSFMTPQENFGRFMSEMMKEDWLVKLGIEVGPTQRLLHKVEQGALESSLPETRKNRLRDTADSLLRSVPDKEQARFDFDVWFRSTAGARGMTEEMFLTVGDGVWDDFMAGFERIRNALGGRFIDPPDLMGLPLGAAIERQLEQRRKREEEQRLERERIEEKLAGERVDIVLRVASEVLGYEGRQIALRASDRLGGLSMVEAARASEVGLRQAREEIASIAAEWAEEARRMDMRDKALAQLRAAVGKAYPRKEHADLWIRQTFRQLGSARPEEYCVDENTLQDCLALLPEHPSRR